jgi:hypothetical protein
MRRERGLATVAVSVEEEWSPFVRLPSRDTIFRPRSLLLLMGRRAAVRFL